MRVIGACFVIGLTSVFLVSGCGKQAVGEKSPAASVFPSDNLTEFRRLHGSDFDPNSKADRDKMAKIVGVYPNTINHDKPAINDPAPAAGSTRGNVVASATSHIGMRETHGSNRSPKIDEMNRLTGVPMGSPWCASWNAYHYQAGSVRSFPKSAWSPDWVASPTWTRAKAGRTPLPGDAFGIWFSDRNRIAHTGIIESWGSDVAVTLEGNTGPSGSMGEADRNGDGSYRKRRMKSTIHSVRNWID